MRRRRRRRHRPQRQPRPTLEAIVIACGCSGDQLPAYLAFARELALTFRRSPPSPDVKTAKFAKSAKTGFSRCDLQTAKWKLDTPRPGKESTTMRRQRFPDFTQRTKRVVAKWFSRGLSGHLLWLIGDRMLDLMFPDVRPRGR